MQSESSAKAAGLKFRELQDFPIPKSPDPAWRAPSVHRVLSQWPSQQESCSEGFLGHKTRQKCIFLHFGNHVKINPVLVLFTDLSGKGGEGTGSSREGREEGFSFSLSLCACLALALSALKEKKGLEFSKMRKKREKPQPAAKELLCNFTSRIKGIPNF